MAQYLIAKEYHEIKLMKEWTPTLIDSSSPRPTIKELKAALIKKQCRIGENVHFTHVVGGVVSSVYPIEGNTNPTKRKGNELADGNIFVCTKGRWRTIVCTSKFRRQS